MRLPAENGHVRPDQPAYLPHLRHQPDGVVGTRGQKYTADMLTPQQRETVVRIYGEPDSIALP